MEVSSQPKLQLNKIAMQFDGRNGSVSAIEDISMDINQGEFVCIVGPSGCGKSTILNILAGMVKPTSGTVLKDGRPMSGPGTDRAVIFQESALFPWLTAVQNVEFALSNIRDKRLRREEAMVQLARVQLSRFANSHPHELSGGMRQRVAIARALAMNPDVLLMDEPFASLDAHTRDLLLAEVQQIWLETGKTIVFVTHNVMEAVTLGDRVICLGTRPGKIKQTLKIELQRPRTLEDPNTAVYAKRIMDHLKDEIAKLIDEESDFQTNEGKRDSSGFPIPRAGLMGDGI